MGFFSAVKRFFGQKTPQNVNEDNQPIPSSDSPLPNTQQVNNEHVNSQEKNDLQTDLLSKDSSTGIEDNCTDSANTTEVEISDKLLNREMEDREVKSNYQEIDEDGIDEIATSLPIMNASAGSTEGSNEEDNELLLKLRDAPPQLSSWLAIILADQEKADEEFWRRLRFLLNALEAPPREIDSFLADFSKWLDRMEYTYVDEFRSELQYRLALALDLEDEEDERNRLLLKLEQSLAATRTHIGRQLEELFTSHGKLDDAFWEEMEELFITADMGYETSLEIVSRLKKRAREQGIKETVQVRTLLQEELVEVFKMPLRIRGTTKPEVVLMMGVNGAGKTTTIAKLAYRDRLNGKRVLVVAADTFRAAAMEQLKVWADRAGADFYQKPQGSDPASVAWEGMDYALKNNIDIVYIDTAGRLQTRTNLMEELGKIRQVLGKKHPGAPHRNILVLDATTGQNALSQAKLFKEGGGADEVILTKLDGTAKGGMAIAVAMRESLPITFIGLGEKMEDLRPFDGSAFANAILNYPSQAA